MARNRPDTMDLPDRPVCLQAAKRYIEMQWQEIRQRHEQGASGTDIVHALASAADMLTAGTFYLGAVAIGHRRTLLRRVALCAQGSYGRGELNPYSDLDVCLLYEGEFDEDIERLNGYILPFLWDMGFSVGYAVRSVPEACDLAQDDLRAFTSMWQARNLAGNSMVFARLKLCIRDAPSGEQTHKHIRQLIQGRNGDLAPEYADLYATEPHIKEQKGGLRDFHVGLWLFMVAYGARDLDEVAAQGLIGEDENLRVAQALDFIWRVRNENHFFHGRADDTLTFANQVHVAESFGYLNESGPDVVRLMEDYYAAARTLRRFFRAASRSWTDAAEVSAAEPHDVEGRGNIAVESGKLHAGAQDANWFAENHVRLMEVFWRSAQLGAPLSHATEKLVAANLHHVTDAFRSSDLVRRFFVAICERSLDAGRVFRQMMRTGLLYAYLPEFTAIRGVIRYEDFHHYPVDEHTIRAVEALAGLTVRDDPVTRCLYVSLEHLSDPHILVLAILFHDLGKAEGDVHTEESERLTRDIGRRMGLPDDETEHVAFLVRHHILMTHISQYRDIDDEEIVRSFAETMKTEQRLRELFLLSYADLRAVGPNVWNDWKGALLMKLYLRAERILLGRADAPQVPISHSSKALAVKQHVRAGLKTDVDSYLQVLGDRYLVAFSAEQIAVHMECLAEASASGLAIHCNTLQDAGTTEVVICTKDRPGRFSELAGCFAAQLFNVNSAAAFSGPAGLVLDSFTVSHARRHRPLTAEERQSLEGLLHSVLVEGADVRPLVDRARNRLFAVLQPSYPLRTQINFDNHSSRTYTVIDVETGDRTGLLYDVTRAMTDSGLDIHTARVVTDARRVRDAFYVTRDGKKIEDEQEQAALRAAIHSAIHPRSALEIQGGRV